MKSKKLFPLLLISTIFLASCSTFNSMEKNKLIVETLDNDSSVSYKINETRILSEEDAKLKALETLENFFNIKLYLTEVDCNVYFNDSNQIKNSLSRIGFNNNQNLQFENNYSLSGSGSYIINFYSKKSVSLQEKEFDTYITELDAKTGKLLSFDHYFFKYPTNSTSNISIEEAETFASGFIVKNNIGGISIANLIDKEKTIINKNTYYRFIFEDRDTSSKKVIIEIDGNSKKVCSLLAGTMTTPANH
ncbi:hypothetical protein KQI89_07135 [Clostridium sp. MSJ-4]|uniref:Lipoprotein n=1 Tax=Clostridium simiarum TaxID=2841506 RepID=A0ABS6F0X9_9CLOT|nr:hypothetical protein [Clostridium simiarum]MBU5591534.1 hypothetical protein [Clostridium simiarum]